MNIHVGRAGQQLGVFSLDQVRAMLARGELRPDDLGWREGMAAWQPLSQIIPPDVVAPPPIAASGGFIGSRTGFASRPPKPSNNLVPAILVTVFCCIPFGIPSIIYASQVDGKYTAGDYSGAENSAAKSRMWMWWGLGVGLVGTVLAVGLQFAAVASSGSF